MKRPYWFFSISWDGEFWIDSADHQNWARIPKGGGTSWDYPQQRSIGSFLKMCAEKGWLDDSPE